jgi:hypothetical protein
MAKFEKEDAVANAILSLEGLDDQLADIKARLDEGKISAAEAFAETTLAVNGTTTSLAGAAKGLGFLGDAIAKKFEILVETGQVDEARRKLEWLVVLAEKLQADDWFSTNVGRSTPGGTREQTVDGERPIVVQSTTNLQFEGQTVQSITATQEAQKRGSR